MKKWLADFALQEKVSFEEEKKKNAIKEMKNLTKLNYE